MRGQDGVSPDQLASRISWSLPKGFQAITAASAAQEQQDQVNQGLGFLSTGLLVFGFVALFVGAFIIFNTFNIVVAQRSRELALFRALGASRRQVMTSVLVEAVVVGLVASLGGVLLGIVLAIGLKALLAGLGLKLPPTALVVASRTVIVSLILGTGITWSRPLSPARRASRVAPLEALRESAASSSSIRRRVIVGTLVTLAGVGALRAGSSGASRTRVGRRARRRAHLHRRRDALPAGRPPDLRHARPPFRRRIAGKLGGENANRNPRRTASTAAALMIGLGLVTFVAVFAASLKASVTASLDRTCAPI